jgi:hypothetical protein
VSWLIRRLLAAIDRWRERRQARYEADLMAVAHAVSETRDCCDPDYPCGTYWDNDADRATWLACPRHQDIEHVGRHRTFYGPLDDQPAEVIAAKVHHLDERRRRS